MEKMLTDEEMEDLMVEFDEMGFEPTTLVPNFQEYARDYKQRLIDLFNRQKAEIERLKNETTYLQGVCRKPSAHGAASRQKLSVRW